MTNEFRPEKVIELVKPQASRPGNIQAAVESLCEPLNQTCTGTFSISCPVYSSKDNDNEILF